MDKEISSLVVIRSSSALVVAFARTHQEYGG